MKLFEDCEFFWNTVNIYVMLVSDILYNDWHLHTLLNDFTISLATICPHWIYEMFNVNYSNTYLMWIYKNFYLPLKILGNLTIGCLSDLPKVT